MEKINALLKSRRFWTAVGGVLVVVLHDAIGLDVETANGIAAFGIAWIIGDSIQKTT